MLDSYLTFYQSTCQSTRLPTYLCTMYLNDATIQHRFVPEVTPSCTRFNCMICPDVKLGKITNWKQAQPNYSKAGKVRNEGSNGCNPKLHWHLCFCQLRQSMAESHFRTRRVIISARKSPEFSPVPRISKHLVWRRIQNQRNMFKPTGIPQYSSLFISNHFHMLSCLRNGSNSSLQNRHISLVPRCTKSAILVNFVRSYTMLYVGFPQHCKSVVSSSASSWPSLWSAKAAT